MGRVYRRRPPVSRHCDLRLASLRRETENERAAAGRWALGTGAACQMLEQWRSEDETTTT